MATTAQPTNGTGNGTGPRRRSLLARARDAVSAALRAANGQAPLLPPSPFDAWTIDDAAEAVDLALDAQTIDTSALAVGKITPVSGEARAIAPRGRQDPIAINRAFFQGDHWQDGSGYIGPHPAPGENGYAQTMQEIGLIFTSQNVIREGTMRHANGCVGKPWAWAYVPRRELGDQEPTTEEQSLIDEATGFMRDWLLARKVPKLMNDAVCTLLLAERSGIRLTIPAGLATTENGVTTVTAASVQEALAKIWPEHASPEDSCLVTDGDTKLEAGVVMLEADLEDDDRNSDGETEDVAWITFLDETANTILRVLREGEDAESPESDAQDTTPLAMGGRIAMFEMRRSALITPQVQQAQRALNFALTMVPRNVTTGGFLERLLLDARMPGEPEMADGVPTGKWIPKPFYVGAGTTNFIEGAEYETTDAAGNVVKTRGSPSVVFRDPIKPDASLAAKDAHYQSMLQELGQLHVLISGDATASAVARIQARVEYLNTLLVTAPEVEAALRWLLETALAMAEAIAESPGKYTSKLRAQVQCKLDTGPITPEERGAVESSIGKTISQETAMRLLGVDDLDAERTRMEADPLVRAARAKVIGEALTALTTPGATLEGAAKFLGLTSDEIEALMTPETTRTALPNESNQGNAGNTGNTGNAAQSGTAGTSSTNNGGEGDTKQGSSSSSAPGGQLSGNTAA